MNSCRIDQIDSFDVAFGDLGLRVGRRTGPNKRAKAAEEWFVLRMFLEPAVRVGYFDLPIYVRKGCEVEREPDFVITAGMQEYWIEVTQATGESDQKEFQQVETRGGILPIGRYLSRQGREQKGRYEPGEAWAEKVWADDVLKAVDRKTKRVIFLASDRARHLIVYPNSNPAFLLLDEDAEHEAASVLQQEVFHRASELGNRVNGCLVHVVGKFSIYFDIVNEFRVWRRPSK
ncbi:hypothetical protein [Rhodoplanes sp. SY1]|uniref:hypothetical protein n=1 Tax=Rhodoplanes sp. SY1 TaxID=3166646 RepID=UPI0038B54583